MTYEEQLQRPEWYYVRDRILERDKFRCRECKYDRNLEVHHLYYENGKMAWQYPDSALITLCNSCHAMTHGKAAPVDALEMSLNRLVRVAGYGVRDWCEKQFPKEEDGKTIH